MADVNRLREMATDHALHRTHYDGCEDSHLECAALAAAEEIERLRAVCQNLFHVIMCTEPGCQRCHEGAEHHRGR